MKVLALSLLLVAQPAQAQPPESVLQGFGCLFGGSVGMSTAWFYSELLLAPTVAGLLPILVAGFSTGCGIGGTLMPIAIWMLSRTP